MRKGRPQVQVQVLVVDIVITTPVDHRYDGRSVPRHGGGYRRFSTSTSLEGTPMSPHHEFERQRQALPWALLFTFPVLVIIAATVGNAVAVGAVLICASLACVVLLPERNPEAFFHWMRRSGRNDPKR